MTSESEYVHFLLEELDYYAQFLAIRDLLYVQEQERKLLHEQIKEMREIAESTSGDANWIAADEWADLCHRSCYQEAAHSMATVGMIAPFAESVFQHAFPEESKRILYGDQYPRKSQDYKVMKLVDEVGMRKYMPPNLKSTLSALFAYRNKMFHHGFEWPRKELDKFDKLLKGSNWPENCFTKAESGEQPWMFYMSPGFVEHCLEVIEKTIKGIEQFDMQRIKLSERKGDCAKSQPTAATVDNDEP